MICGPKLSLWTDLKKQIRKLRKGRAIGPLNRVLERRTWDWQSSGALRALTSSCRYRIQEPEILFERLDKKSIQSELERIRIEHDKIWEGLVYLLSN